MSTSISSHFHRRLAETGLIHDPHRIGHFLQLCQERDAAESGYIEQGGFFSPRIRLDSAESIQDLRVNIRTQQLQAEMRKDGTPPQASQALTHFYNQIYEIRHKDLSAWMGDYLPIDRNVDRAANEYVWYESDLLGVARAGSTYSVDDIPLVEGPTGAQNKGLVAPFLCGFQVNFMDDRRAQLAVRNGKPNFRVEQKKLKAATRVIAEAINSLWLWGDTELGIPGLHTHSGIQVVPLPNGDWANASGLEVLQDMTFMLDFIGRQSASDLGDSSRIRLALPRRWNTLIRNLPPTTAGTGTAASVYTYVRESFDLSPEQIVKRDELASENSFAFQGGPLNLDRDRAMVTYLDADGDEDMSGDPSFVLPQDIELPTAPVQTGMGRVQFLHARAGGLKLPDARRIVMFQGFEAP